MMAHKHLHELLSEDQEPFLLKNYIADRRCQIKKRTLPNTHLQLKKRKPISQNSNFPGNFCKNACLFSFHQDSSPDVRKSPLFEFPSPAKSPCRNSNTIFLDIPARTAAILLEASLRIQKNSSSNSKSKSHIKNAGFGLFGSILKRLTHRNRTRKSEIAGDGVKVSMKDILRWDSSVGRRKFSGECEKVQENIVVLEERSASEMGFSCSCNGRLSSAVWSESNEEKSLDLETSSSSSNSEDSEEIEFVSKERENGDFASCENGSCKSPFHFVLQKSPSSGRRTPVLLSPATSPSRHKNEERENSGGDSLQKFQIEEEEVEKEQCSPVSVLDPPFEDDEDGHDDDDGEYGGFDLECSYAIVQRAKQQLLHKLRRFEKLAELDPIELEKRMLEEEQYSDDNEEDLEEVEESEEDDESLLSNRGENFDGFFSEILSKSCFQSLRRIPSDMKRLVSDLIAEEERGQLDGFNEEEVVVKRVCQRLESWKEVESNTIDMMVDLDFRRELDGWKKNQEQVGETAMEIELAIFGLLMEELSED